MCTPLLGLRPRCMASDRNLDARAELMDISVVIVLVIILTALAFDYTNGFHDTANAVATSIATGALKPPHGGAHGRHPQPRRRVPLG